MWRAMQRLLRVTSLLQATACAGHMLRATEKMETLSVSEAMQRMAHSLPEGNTKSLLHSFKICGSCKTWKRFGEAHDGGYLTCMDGLDRGHIQSVFSMGVSDIDKWSLDMYNLLQRPVSQFDCTVPHAAQACPTCHFFHDCLEAQSGAGAHPSGPNLNLAQALQQSGFEHVPDRSLVMKMDIEGSEWPIFAEMSPGSVGNVLSKFEQVILEFHWLNQKHKHGQYLKAMQNLLAAGFRVAHVHGNDWAEMYHEGQYMIPNVVEVTFVSSGQPNAKCHDPHRNSLDASNNPNSFIDLPDSVLP